MRLGMLTYGMGEHLTGIGCYTRELCLALTRVNRSLEIILINPYPIDSQEFFLSFDNYYVPVLQKLPSVLGLGPVLLPIISKRMGLDVFHDPCGISPFLTRRKRNATRRVVTVHDTVSYVYPHVQPFLTRFTFRTLIPAARRNVDAILTVSECSRQDLIKYLGFPSDQIHVAYPGVCNPTESDICQLRANGHVLRKWNVSNPYFLYVGALNPRKNVPSLITAFERVLRYRSDVKLVLVGPNTWWADDTLRAAKRFEQSVVLTGFIDDRELSILYAHATALVYPSIYEGFGLPPLEAMAYGTPVITSNVSSLPEVVADAGFMVDPMDISALSASMIRALDPDVSFELSRKGRRRAQQFTWETTARQTLHVYESTL